MLSKSLVVATLLSLSSAIPFAAPQDAPSDGVRRWQVKGWLVTCGAASTNNCSYELRIRGEETSGIAALNTSCTGKFFDGGEKDGKFQPCANENVSIRITPSTDGDPVNVILQASLKRGGTGFTSSGTKARLITRDNPQTFDVEGIEERLPSADAGEI
ncbi:hypothetical protein HYFRA_00005167 [Hymenoscyphus fraxineus]|uniref:Hypersensitive response-inducing protein n=1 Tax=Hymenoscyphus fraxineus TaxID=746836 RepID=A0A9N9Q0H1_9HELO|nr:hypothetical protein HYFRA_00005167 [Hymenoscyphus fraxineus]